MEEWPLALLFPIQLKSSQECVALGLARGPRRQQETLLSVHLLATLGTVRSDQELCFGFGAQGITMHPYALGGDLEAHKGQMSILVSQ
ncbi:hypothetical protein JRQ81_002554 [Phrynocephalus forsythii]|uniref:Uncharacterized protein n=1 Tax=Phrynocephalus forsythii TaxID=171643 RepID=A0A9Q0XLF0_9SAUR|nr:hypothetical protein JRQ81_002554 [Phrynocephalus forsythii]